MKKTYMTPVVEITETLTQQMMAVSFEISEDATDTQLAPSNVDWNIWEEE